MSPIERLKCASRLLPEEAFLIEGLHYTRSEVEKWLELQEYEVLVIVLGSIGDHYESERASLPGEYWEELRQAAQELGYSEILAAYLSGSQPQADSGVVSGLVGQGRFIVADEAGDYVAMRDSGRTPVEIGAEAVRLGASRIDAVRLLRGLFGFDLRRAMSVYSEVEAAVRDKRV
ncbi:hypothetical protein HPC50_38385 [Corallococcus exiguus]|uniref:hypothetical protein n=1 Tax=Corallococcus TaxID=83461 RepID=UPI0011C3A72E|nr:MULTISPECIES: hypothetical protein [Corallococcus]NNB89061.1 hypothetical protein [Corallococcus exiguus]NPC52930.1 hypothetical protein [Corallococcus exiguus]